MRTRLHLAALVAALAIPAAAQSLLYQELGTAADQRFGAHVGSAGDVDGDGLPDVLIGAPGDDGVGTDAGAAHARRGVDGAPLQDWLGEAAGDEFGCAVADAGDVDQDGHADVLVGAYRSDGAFPGGGRAYIFSGADGGPLLVLDADGVGDEFGIALDGVGDVTGDGLPDVAVGAHHDDVLGPSSGSIRVCSGVDGAVWLLLTGDEQHDDLGHAVAGCGDINLDGVPDLIGGMHDSVDPGRARVYSGVDGAVLHEWTGLSAGDFFGHAVAGAGDVNKDGVADLVVGASRDDTAGNNAGRAWLYSGADGAEMRTWSGEQQGDLLGAWVDGAGDWDVDGVLDVIVGVPGDDDAGTDSGSARIYSGATGGKLLHWNGGSPGLRFDVVVSGLGDVDADGRRDVAVAFPYDDTAGTDAGLVQLVTDLGTGPWTFLGGGLAGATGVPVLAGTGQLSPGTPGAILLTGAAPSAPCVIYFSLVAVSVPFKGGTLSAFPPITAAFFVTNPVGGVVLAWPAWTDALPPGLEMFFQMAIADAGAIKNVAISNLLMGVTQP